MHKALGLLGASLFVLAPLSTVNAGALLGPPVDLTDTTDRQIRVEVVTNGCPLMDDPMIPGDERACYEEGVYASDPEAEFALLRTCDNVDRVPPDKRCTDMQVLGNLAFGAGDATIGIPAAEWEGVQIRALGVGVSNVSALTIGIDIATGLGFGGSLPGTGICPVTSSAPCYWTGNLDAGFPLNLVTREATDSLGIASEDTFYYTDLAAFGVFVATSCSDPAAAPADPQTECQGIPPSRPFRAHDPYDPADATFTFLASTDNGLLAPAYVPLRWRITELPEPAAAALQLGALVAIAGLAGCRRRRSLRGQSTRSAAGKGGAS